MKNIKNSHIAAMALAIGTMAASAFITSCAGEEDDIFSATAAERLNESKAKYSARLEAQPNGWAMQYYPTYSDESPYGSGYLLLMDFDPDGSVRVAMDNRFSNNAFAIDTSAWEVIKDNGPVLSFNSFNKCMHAFSDPENIPWTEENEQGEGCNGDYEFIIVDAPEDASYMMLKGKKRNTYNLLTPIEEGVDYQEYLADVKAFHNLTFPANELVSCLMHFGDSIYRMDGSNDGLPNIYPYESDAIANESFQPFLITKRGEDYYLRFRDVFEKDFIKGTLQEMRFDTIAQEFVGTDAPEWRITSYDPTTFFYEAMKAIHFWQFTADTEMEGPLAEAVATVSKGFADRKYTISNIRFGGRGKDGCVTLNLKQGKNTVALTYLYDIELTPEGCTMTYREPYTTKNDKKAEAIFATVPTVQDFLDAINGTYTAVKTTKGAFDLSGLKVTSTNGNVVEVKYMAK